MASFNGFVAQLIKGSSTGGEFAVFTGTSRGGVSNGIPQKILRDALIAVHTQGISGTYAVDVVSVIGGASFVIAGATGIAADGTTILGGSGTVLTIPRPSFVAWSSAEDGAGFTSSVHICGNY